MKNYMSNKTIFRRLLLGAFAATSMTTMLTASANATSYRTMYIQCTKKFNKEMCTDLGLYTIQKRGEPTNGIHYLQRACKLEDAKACIIMGNIYRDGVLAQTDPFMAKRYYNAACIIGSSTGCDLYNNYRPIVSTKSSKNAVVNHSDCPLTLPPGYGKKEPCNQR